MADDWKINPPMIKEREKKMPKSKRIKKEKKRRLFIDSQDIDSISCQDEIIRNRKPSTLPVAETSEPKHSSIPKPNLPKL